LSASQTIPASGIRKEAKAMQNTEPVAPAKFRRILVAADFSGSPMPAVRLALRLGMTHQASLEFLHVFELSEHAAVPVAKKEESAEPSPAELAAKRRLEEALAEAKAAGVKASIVVKPGIAPVAILEAVQSTKADLLILGTNGYRGMERIGQGSTAEAVLRKCPCPVLTIGPHAAHIMQKQPPTGAVVFATDFNRAGTPAIGFASLFSRLLDAPLRCLHVLPRMVEGVSGDEAVPSIIKVALQHIANEAQSTGHQPQCDIGYGCDVSYAVIEYARQYDAQLIVLGVRQTPLHAAHLPAQIAYRIITEAMCPVLTIAVQHNDAAKLSAACL